MPTPGWNLFVYYQQFRHEVAGAYENAADTKWTEQLVIQKLNEAQRALQQKLKIASKETTATLTAGTATYNLPAGMKAHGMFSVRLGDSSGTGSTVLRYREYARFRELFPSEETYQGVPEYWTFVPNTRTIEIGPIPNYTKADGLRYFFGYNPTPLRRIYKPSGITLSLTNGSASGTFSGAIDSVKIRAGDELGIIESTQFDGSSVPSLNRIPSIWYEVSAASGTSLTLTENYDWSTASGIVWVSAEVPDIDRLYQGRFGKTLVNLAVSEVLRRDDPQKSQFYESIAMEEISGFYPEVDETDSSARTVQRYPNFFTSR